MRMACFQFAAGMANVPDSLAGRGSLSQLWGTNQPTRNVDNLSCSSASSLASMSWAGPGREKK
ncbi:hypothetical protein SAMN05428936_102542 [Pelagibacterium halotolerans]|nr:hypothetical protein SAMN05428936_102542 [Pelagibacterium halotolerans]